jgi:hypothetical protein
LSSLFVIASPRVAPQRVRRDHRPIGAADASAPMPQRTRPDNGF